MKRAQAPKPLVGGTSAFQMGPTRALPLPDPEPYNLKKLRKEVKDLQSETYAIKRKRGS